jgi:hypothetical protein
LPVLATYFTNHPTHANAPLNVTAAQATALFTALSDARSAVNVSLTQVGQKRAARDAARRALERQLRGLIHELYQLLEDDDPRWLSFGLNMPGAEVTPEGPTDLVLTEAPNAMIFADWADVANADHYRVYVQRVGVDAGFVDQPGVRTESDATLGPYQEGQTIRVKVTAVSGGLEGPASSVAEITLTGGGNGGGGGGVPATPGQPTLTALSGGQVQVQWTAVANTQYYTVQKNAHRHRPGICRCRKRERRCHFIAAQFPAARRNLASPPNRHQRRRAKPARPARGSGDHRVAMRPCSPLACSPLAPRAESGGGENANPPSDMIGIGRFSLMSRSSRGARGLQLARSASGKRRRRIARNGCEWSLGNETISHCRFHLAERDGYLVRSLRERKAAAVKTQIRRAT